MEQLKKAVRKSVTGRKMSDQFYVDGDVNVPDDKGDVGRIVYSQGMLRVEDMKQSGSYVRVSGRIQYRGRSARNAVDEREQCGINSNDRTRKKTQASCYGRT